MPVHLQRGEVTMRVMGTAPYWRGRAGTSTCVAQLFLNLWLGRKFCGERRREKFTFPEILQTKKREVPDITFRKVRATKHMFGDTGQPQRLHLKPLHTVAKEKPHQQGECGETWWQQGQTSPAVLQHVPLTPQCAELPSSLMTPHVSCGKQREGVRVTRYTWKEGNDEDHSTNL